MTNRKLIDRLRSELKIELPADVEVRRTYAGRTQKNVGAWSWFLYSRTDPRITEYGSPHTVGELLRSRSLTAYRNTGGHIEILPADVPAAL
jgi:hypothetical protein